MSRPRVIETTCKDCGSKQPVTIWQSLNADLNPEAKEALMNGELARFACASCGSVGEVVYPFLYHDMERQLMIALLVEDACRLAIFSHFLMAEGKSSVAGRWLVTSAK